VDLVRRHVVAAVAFEPADFVDEEVMRAAHPEFAARNLHHAFRRLLQRSSNHEQRQHCGVHK
jgi:hypothetical protein